MTRYQKIGRLLLSAGALWPLASSARAHIRLEGAGTHESRDGDAQKEAPCGSANSKRGAKIYTYAPGETITISVSEYVPHPGYFRIAFDKDGDDSFKDPVSIDPIDTSRANQGPTDKDKGSDFCNNETVLMDNLDPHLSAGLGGLVDDKVWTWKVKLPDVECDNCTLQILQIMEDPLGHGAYDGDADIYHQCLDLVLKRKDASAQPTGAFPECTIGERILGQVGGGSGGSTNPAKPDAGTAKDAGTVVVKDAGVSKGDSSTPSEPASADPGPNKDPGDSVDEEASSDDEHARGSSVDAGKPDTTKKDAGTKGDSQEDDDEDEDDDEPAASADEGCAVASRRSVPAWVLLLAGALVARRVRASRRERNK